MERRGSCGGGGGGGGGGRGGGGRGGGGRGGGRRALPNKQPHMHTSCVVSPSSCPVVLLHSGESYNDNTHTHTLSLSLSLFVCLCLFFSPESGAPASLCTIGSVTLANESLRSGFIFLSAILVLSSLCNARAMHRRQVFHAYMQGYKLIYDLTYAIAVF